MQVMKKATHSLLSLTLITSVLFTDSSHAQSYTDLEVSYTGSRAFMITNRGVRPTRTYTKPVYVPPVVSSDANSARALINTTNFINSNSSLYKIRDTVRQLKPLAVLRNQDRSQAVNFQQVHNNIPVLGAVIKSGTNASSEVEYTVGNFISNINIGTTPRIKAADAQMLAMRHLFYRYSSSDVLREFVRQGRLTDLLQLFTPINLVIYNPDFIANPAVETNRNYLAWHIKVAITPEMTEEFVIDANTGAILKQVDARHFAAGEAYPTPGPRSVYDCTTGCSCNLNFRSSLHNNYIFGRGEGQAARGPNPVHGTRDVDSVYDKSLIAWEFYLNRFARSGATGLGGIGINKNLSYTFYEGCHSTSCHPGRAWFVSSPQPALVFCRGASSYDIFGHEYFHAFVSSTLPAHNGVESSALFGLGETGSVNEGLADFFGEVFQSTYEGTDWVWGTGQNSLMPTEYKRSLSNPPAYRYSRGSVINRPYPDRYDSPNMFCGTENNGGVHENSTIISKAMYLASQGGSFNGCSISGVGQEKVTQVLYRMLTTRSTTVMPFKQFYEAVFSTCRTFLNPQDQYIYGITPQDCANIDKGMRAVEIDLPGGCHNGQPIGNQRYASCAFTNVAGDYDNDNDVDEDDYLVYKSNFGRVGLELAGDGNRNGIVDAADYTVWRANFVRPPAGTGSGSGVY